MTMTANDEIVISVKNVSKDFILPHLRKTSVKSVFTGVFESKKNSNKSEVQHALKNISFDIKKGEFFGIVGRNGSGKSTLLKILAGIYQPTKGTVGVTGKLVPFIELGVGFNPELTGRENVYLNGALLGFDSKTIDTMYDDIVDFAELERFMDQKLKNYSSGMQVRLAFSMAIRSEADILLIDEVLAVGDADFQRKCFEYFKSLKKNKKTVVFVSHDMEAVREYCDRAVLINDGKVVAEGPSSDIALRYRKMFVESTSDEENDSKNRWGNGPKVIKSVKTSKSITKEDTEIKISVTLLPTKPLDMPIIGYVINNSAGQSIVGSNTRQLDVKTDVYPANQEVEIDFICQNVFADGTYQVDVAIVANDGITAIDWWVSAAKFKVYEDVPSTYLVSPNVKVAVTKV